MHIRHILALGLLSTFVGLTACIGNVDPDGDSTTDEEEIGDEGIGDEDTGDEDSGEENVGEAALASHITNYKSGAGCPEGTGSYKYEVEKTKKGCCTLTKTKYDVKYSVYNCYASCPAYNYGLCYEKYTEMKYNDCQVTLLCL